MDQLETQPIDQDEIPMLDETDMPPGITFFLSCFVLLVGVSLGA